MYRKASPLPTMGAAKKSAPNGALRGKMTQRKKSPKAHDSKFLENIRNTALTRQSEHNIIDVPAIDGSKD